MEAHGRNGMKFSMLMYSDDLPSVDIDADGYCCHFMRSSVCPTVRGLRFWCCGQIACKKVYVLACWCIQMSYPPFIDAYGYLWYHCPSVHWSGHLDLGLLGLGLVRGGLSYINDLGMAVVITKGYEGYLLPLLAAYFSSTLHLVLRGWCLIDATTHTVVLLTYDYHGHLSYPS